LEALTHSTRNTLTVDMKLAGLITVFGADFINSMPSSNAPPPAKQLRRFKDFRRLFESVFSSEEMNKIYGYGCYCLNRGDQPQLGDLTGVQPMDEVDNFCLKWNKCNRCASVDRNDKECTPGLKEYTFNFDEPTQKITCTNRKHSCSRSLCECDKWAVENMREMLDKTNPDYLASNGFDNLKQCKSFPVKNLKDSRGQTACCGETLRQPFNTGQKQCCNNQNIKGLNETC
jgi:hypothetical protein